MENQLYPSGLNAAENGNHTDYINEEDSYTKVREHFGKKNPTPEECEAFLDYLMSDDRHWGSVERLFNEIVKEDENPSVEAGISLFILSVATGSAKKGSRIGMKKVAIMKSLNFNLLRFRKKKNAQPD